MSILDRVGATVRQRVFHKYEPKDEAELAYWLRRDSESGKDRPNAYYEDLFTTMFEIPRAFYAGKKILDVGCGPCGSLEWATDAARRVGLDPLAERYRELDVGGSSHHQMEYCSAPVEHLPFDDGYFDVVSSLNSLDHVDDLDKALAELHRVLVQGGAFLLEVEFGHRPTPCEPIEIPQDLDVRLGADYEIKLHERFLSQENMVHSAYIQRIPYPEGKRYRPGVMILHLVKR